MKQWTKGGFLYYVAGVLLVLMTWLLLRFIGNPASLEVLRYVGWIIWAVSIVLLFLPMFVLRSKGRVEKGKDYTYTQALVDSGIYAVVRHPQYLGWILMYLAGILFGQHWLIALLGVAGMACVYLISRQEDQRLVEKFGDTYKRYMRSVPAMNLLAGVIRLVRRRDRGCSDL